MKKSVTKKSVFVLLFLLIMVVPIILPLFHNEFFVTDDADWMIVRFSAFHQTLADGQFPPRFLGRLNHGYGYPVATFLYPGFLYLAEPVHLIGFGFIDSIKIILGLSFVCSGVFIYLWLKKFFDNFSSFIGALFYLYTPYHLFDVYQRGSVGEVLALAVFPFLLWQIERKSLFWSSFGLALLLLSHNTLAVLFLFVLLWYLALDIVIAKDKKPLILHSLSVLLFGLGLSAFFWIPALFELQYTVFAKITVSNWREYFAGISLIGYATIAIILFILFQLITRKIVFKKHRLTVMLFVFGVLSLFFATPISTALWEILPVGFIQFPFRILSITILCIAFLAACSLSLLSKKQKYVVGGIFVTLLIISALPFLQPKAYIARGDEYYATNMATTTVHDEYMPIWVKDKPVQKPESKVQIVKGRGESKEIIYNNKEIRFAVDGKENTTVQVNTIYWSGWKALVDGKEATILYNNPRGVMRIFVPQGEHEVKLLFGETPLRLASDILSLVSLVFLIVIIKSKFKE